MTDANEQPRPVIGRIVQLTTEPARPALEEVMQIDSGAPERRPVAPPPVSSDAGSDAGGDIHTCSYYCDRPACIKAQRDELREQLEARQAVNEQPAVPLPEYDINTASHTHVRIRGYTDRAMRAYGEACAAAALLRKSRENFSALQEAIRAEQKALCERDELRARAEAAEAKIAEGGKHAAE